MIKALKNFFFKLLLFFMGENKTKTSTLEERVECLEHVVLSMHVYVEGLHHTIAQLSTVSAPNEKNDSAVTLRLFGHSGSDKGDKLN